MYLLIILTLLTTPKAKEKELIVKKEKTFNLEKGIKILNPNLKQKYIDMVAKTIKYKASKYGFYKKDYPLILAMISNESDFRHIKGAAGEVGMLQVIPTENHIKKIVARYIRCRPTERYCKKNGRADIYNRQLRISGWKVKRFLLKHPKYALEVGFGEMRFWKKRFDRYIKRRYWKNFPCWYYKKKHPEKFNLNKVKIKSWWRYAKTKAGDILWVSAYNWGSKIVIGNIARGYPLRVLYKYNKVLGRKRKTPFKQYKPKPLKIASLY